jgi:hypothetical protein
MFTGRVKSGVRSQNFSLVEGLAPNLMPVELEVGFGIWRFLSFGRNHRLEAVVAG